MAEPMKREGSRKEQLLGGAQVKPDKVIEVQVAVVLDVDVSRDMISREDIRLSQGFRSPEGLFARKDTRKGSVNDISTSIQ